jgi:FtsP/CotA-like multicopper oxidase with cupredoxin domain
MPDNAADALNIKEGSNSYIKFVTTDGSESVAISKATSFASSVGHAAPTTSTPSGTTQTITWSNGNIQKLSAASASGNITVTFSAPPTGSGRLTLFFIQGGTARTVTWPATVKWPGGVAPTLTTTNGGVDKLEFVYDGTNYYGTSNLAFA